MKLELNQSYIERKNKYFPGVTDDLWNDWKWQTSNRIRRAEDLKKYIPLTSEGRYYTSYFRSPSYGNYAILFNTHRSKR